MPNACKGSADQKGGQSAYPVVRVLEESASDSVKINTKKSHIGEVGKSFAAKAPRATPAKAPGPPPSIAPTIPPMMATDGAEMPPETGLPEESEKKEWPSGVRTTYRAVPPSGG